MWTQTSFPRVLYRFAGATVGRHVSFHYNYPNQPEMRLLSYGECAYLGCFTPYGPTGIYSHNFGKGYLKFDPTRVEAAVRNDHTMMVSPGSTVPAGATVGPRTCISKVSSLACQP